MAAGLDMTLDMSEIRKAFTAKSVAVYPLAAQAMFTTSHAILVPAIKQRIRSNKSVFRGQLISRIAVRSVVKQENPTIDVGALGVPYAADVELGQPPHSADLTKLVEYARKKMGYPKTPREKKKSKRPSADAVAVAIWKTLRKHGSKPHPYIMPTWDAVKGQFAVDFFRRYGAALSRAK